jgi:hypothetical protein
VDVGIPWLGFVVYPTYRRVKARKVCSAHRRLRSRLADYHAGQISYAELSASIRGWIDHVRYADSWGLRRHVLETLVVRPGPNTGAPPRQGRVGKNARRHCAPFWNRLRGVLRDQCSEANHHAKTNTHASKLRAFSSYGGRSVPHADRGPRTRRG